MKKVRLGVLDCDELAAPLKADFKCYAEMFRTLLQSSDSDLEICVYSVIHGQYPPRLEDCDAYLLTGSKVGVYDEVSWLDSLADFIRQAYENQVPLVGICFGHQMLAHSLGGKAEKSLFGWGIGALDHQLQLASKAPDWMKDAPENMRLLYSHQDQVTSLPEHATRLYGSEFCPNGAFYISGRVLAFQGHPEFTPEYSARLMEIRRKRYPPQAYQLALGSLSLPLDNALVAQWINRFIRGAHTK